FLYYDKSVEAFWDAIKRAREIFQDDPACWQRLVRRAMAQDFSWEAAAERYEELYAGLLPQAVAA
ncbi:MAG: starch synthase, partial [Verrucomicrobiota bacterium]|nr:starch synthase [Verrucomicrobiota bacterium]